MPPTTAELWACTVKEASRLTGRSADYLRALVRAGKLTVVDNGLRGKARRYTIVADELRVLATMGERALREFRAREKRHLRLA